MWRKHGITLHPILPLHTSTPRVRPTPHACVSKVADGSRRYKKTCPSRSKERHSCQLVTCTSSRQASSSAGSSCEPASPAFRNEHHPAHPHRDIDAFATGDRLIAISREISFPWNNSTALIKLVHDNPSTSIAAQPCGPRLRLPWPVTIGKFL